jgi:predicted anti-sigma-YlaC factor YlaD
MRYAMKCHKFQKKLSAYQDRELKHRNQEEVRKHLLSCQSCRTQYENFERTWQILGEFEEIRPDPWSYPQLIRKIKESRQKRSLPAAQHVFQLLKTPAIASILMAVGIFTGTYLGNILVRCDFSPFQTAQATYSQQALFDSLRVFDPAPPGTLAYGYLQMANYEERESR